MEYHTLTLQLEKFQNLKHHHTAKQDLLNSVAKSGLDNPLNSLNVTHL
jgi:hypothetical protein